MSESIEEIASKKLEELGLNTMREWRVALKEYLRTHFTDIK